MIAPRLALTLLACSATTIGDGCGLPTGSWYSTCDLARASPFTVTAAGAASAAECPGGAGAKAFHVTPPATLLCVLTNGSYWLSAIGGRPAVGQNNATTCASIAWHWVAEGLAAPTRSAALAVPLTAASTSGWCRLPRSTACAPCLNPNPPPPTPPSPSPPGPPPPAPPLPPAPPAPLPPVGAKAVVAFADLDPHQPSFWIDYDWSILTHVIVFGSMDPNLFSYAAARDVKIVLSYSGCDGQDMRNATVRQAIVADALRFAPPPYGSWHHNCTTGCYAGFFFDIECTEQPCPWLEPGQAMGMAAFFSELRRAWPAVFLSLYVSGNGDARISGVADSDNATFPFEYSQADVMVMQPFLDQVVFGGYSALNYSFLDANAEVNCHPDNSASEYLKTCGGINPMQTIRYALNGTAGSAACQAEPGYVIFSILSSNSLVLFWGFQQNTDRAHASHPCAALPWSSVVPKGKLVYAVGWYNMQHNIHNITARDKLGSSPSFCATLPLSQHKGVAKHLDASGTWVFDRTDPTGTGFRVWYDDEVSLAPKYAAVREAGWGGVGMWLASGMYPNGIHVSEPHVFDDYCPDGLRRMWASIADNFVKPE